jgi:hypothetical protein
MKLTLLARNRLSSGVSGLGHGGLADQNGSPGN